MSHDLTNALIQTQAAYDAVTQSYETMTATFHHLAVYPRLQEILIKHLGSFTNRHILDTGCGTGRLIQLLKDQGARCSGLELSSESVKVAQSRNLDVVQGSMHQLPFAANEFDAVVENFALNYLPIEGQRSALEEKYRVLRPGGIVTFSCMHPSHMRMQYIGKSACRLVAPDYFHPQHIQPLSQLGQTFTLHLLDWTELVSLVTESGFTLKQLIDITPPLNLKQFIENAPTSEARMFIESLQYNPCGLIVVASKA